MADSGFGAGLVQYCRVTAIGGLSKATTADVQGMYDDLSRMMLAGEKPDIGTIHVAVKAFVVRGDAEAVDRILNMTKDLNCANFDVMLFSMWINVHSEIGNVERGEQILGMMKESGVEPNVRTYTTLMKAYIARKDLASAERQLTDMMANDVKPDVVTFNSLIHAYTVQGDTDKAESFLSQMMDMGISPDNLSFHFLRKTYNRRGDRKALQRLQDLQNAMPHKQMPHRQSESRLRLPNDQSSRRSYLGSPHSGRHSMSGSAKGTGKGHSGMPRKSSNFSVYSRGSSVCGSVRSLQGSDHDLGTPRKFE
jgi:pentatricopeptide repeat protein